MIKKLILFGILFANLTYGQDEMNRGYIVEIGQPSPLFSFEETNGKVFNLSDHIGKVIMIQFTASWCSVCIKEMPYIEKDIWQIHNNNENFLLLALAKDDIRQPQNQEDVHFMRQKTGATYPIEIDKKSEIFQLFASKKAGVTRNIIINKKGEISYLTRLFDINEFNEMVDKIDELLKTKD